MSNEQTLSKILVPMDGSEPSFHAAIIANNIAKKFNSEIIVLYVVVSPSSYEYANLTGLVTPKQIDMIIQNAKDEAKDWFNKVENIVREGNPNAKLTMKILVTEIALYGEIIQYAEQENIDNAEASQNQTNVVRNITNPVKSTILPGSSAPGNPSFEPANVTVPKDGGIEWINKDNVPHTITSLIDDGKTFDSKTIKPNATFILDAVTLKETQYDYFCTLHPHMKGKIIVG